MQPAAASQGAAAFLCERRTPMADMDIAPIEQIIEDARNGLPYILVDAPDRENEGDVILPAQFITPRMIWPDRS